MKKKTKPTETHRMPELTLDSYLFRSPVIYLWYAQAHPVSAQFHCQFKINIRIIVAEK